MGGRAYDTGGALARAAKPISGVVVCAIRGAAVTSPLMGFGDYKADTGGVDTSAGGTLDYLREGKFGNAGASLSGGAAEALADSGRGVAKLVDSSQTMARPKPWKALGA